MGVSTDAILAFGFDLGEELPEALSEAGKGDGGDYFDWEEVVGSMLNLPAPDHQDYKKDWPAYWEAKRKAVADFPVALISHCSGEYPMYFLAVNGTERSARRGTPVKIALKAIPPAQLKALRSFCKDWGIEWQEPDWHIFSMWN